MSTLLELNLDLKKGVTIILTHGDMDGITSGAVVADATRTIGYNYIVLADMDPNSKRTEEMFEEAIEIMSEKFGVGSFNGLLYILDRECVSTEFIESNKDRIIAINYCDHHVTGIEKAHKTKRELLRKECTVFNMNNSLNDKYISTANLAVNMADDMFCGHQLSNKIFIDFAGKWQKFADTVALWDTFAWKEGVNEEFDITEERIEYAQNIGKTDKIFPMRFIYDNMMKDGNRYENMKSLCNLASAVYEYNFHDELFKAKRESALEVINNKRVLFIPNADGKYISLVADDFFEEDKVLEVVVGISAKGLGMIRVSKTSDFNAAEAASAIGKHFGFGGGGHVKAAGFKLQEQEEQDGDKIYNFKNEIVEFLKSR